MSISTAMIESLEIRGFRAFKSFGIPDLTRLNLLVGRNNAGKTCVLDAVEILALGGPLGALLNSPIRRDEYYIQQSTHQEPRLEIELSHLFHGHRIDAGSSLEILAERDGAASAVSLKAARTSTADVARNALAEALGFEAAFLLELNSPLETERPPQLPVTPKGIFNIPFGHTEFSHWAQPMPSGMARQWSLDRPNVADLQRPREKGGALYLGTAGATLAVLSQIWEGFIALTPEEDGVYDAMRIIEPSFERLVFTGEGLNTTVLIKLKDARGRLPLGSLGDGIKRLLGLAICMAQAQGGVLLIDEIDTGLHYSTMESMWRFIIEASRRLGVQVFATTHSGDCIRALAWLQTEHPELAQDVSVHRIDKDAPSAVRYSAEDIEIAARHHVEVRG
ncbi:ATP/GTP-binding protein [Thiohalocapsa sp. ML1]|uniref:AAA family ATPase n=1 Tax=Thiohalocapsa sp. ML1 TaxID=1431688 RepID=UPI000AC1C572|nr:ATP-binding protein [Thiohalocapsa sp. ML1]